MHKLKKKTRPMLLWLCFTFQEVHQLGIHEELLENITRHNLRCKFNFVRELISNSHDAYMKLIAETKDPMAATDKHILMNIYEENGFKYFSLEDKGIGMNKEDLINYVGKLGGSGTREFKGTDAIGKFGTGLYASLSVADNLEIITKKFNEEKAYILKLKRGTTSYSIDEIEKEENGTKIIIRIDESNIEDINKKSILEWVENNMLDDKFKDYKLLMVKDEKTEEEKKEEENNGEKKEEEENDGEKKEEEENDEEKKEEEENDEEKKETEMYGNLPVETVKMCMWPKNENQYMDAYKSLKGFGELFDTYVFNFTVKQRASTGRIDQVHYNAVVYIPEFLDMRMFGVENKGKHLIFVGGSLIADSNFSKVPYFLEPMYILLRSSNAHISSSREELLNSKESCDFLFATLQKKIILRIKEIINSDKRDKFFKTYESYIKSGYLNVKKKNDKILQELFSEILSFNTTGGIKLLDEINGKDIYYTNSTQFKSDAPNPLYDGIEGDILFLNGIIDEQLVSALSEYKERKLINIQTMEFGERKIEGSSEYEFLKLCKEELRDLVSNVVISTRLKKTPFFLRNEKHAISNTMKLLMGNNNSGGIFDAMLNSKPILEVNIDSEEYKIISKNQDINLIRAYVVANSIIEDVGINKENSYLSLINLFRNKMGLNEYEIKKEEIKKESKNESENEPENESENGDFQKKIDEKLEEAKNILGEEKAKELEDEVKEKMNENSVREEL